MHELVLWLHYILRIFVVFMFRLEQCDKLSLSLVRCALYSTLQAFAGQLPGTSAKLEEIKMHGERYAKTLLQMLRAIYFASTVRDFTFVIYLRSSRKKSLLSW